MVGKGMMSAEVEVYPGGILVVLLQVSYEIPMGFP